MDPLIKFLQGLKDNGATFYNGAATYRKEPKPPYKYPQGLYKVAEREFQRSALHFSQGSGWKVSVTFEGLTDSALTVKEVEYKNLLPSLMRRIETFGRLSYKR